MALLILCAHCSPSTLAATSAWKADLEEGERRLKVKQLTPAEVCFRNAVSDVRRDKTSSADDVALCLESLANILQMQEETEEAIPLYKKALKTLQQAHGKESHETIPPLLALGDIYRSETQWRVSARYYRQARAIVEAKSGQTSLEFADIQHRLGLVTYSAGLKTMAERMYRSSLEAMIAQKSLPGSAMLDDLLSDYIHLLRDPSVEKKTLQTAVQKELLKDRVESADKNASMGASTWSKSVSVHISDPHAPSNQVSKETVKDSPLPQSSITVDRSLPDFAAVDQINQQRIDFYERMIAIDAKTLGKNHPSMARDLTGLAYVYLLQKNYSAARTLIDRALNIYKASYGSDPIVVQRIELLSKLVNNREHADLVAPSVHDYLATLPPLPAEAKRFQIAVQLNYLALLCFSAGKIEDAEKIWGWAASATAQSAGEQSLLSGAALNDYARVLRSCGNTKEAQSYERDADDILARSLMKQASAIIP